jgi:hypothetical protein
MIDLLEHFSWLVFGAVVLIYSAMTFRGELAKEGNRLIFSKQNSRPPSQVVEIHLAFLTALLGLMWTISICYPMFPDWMTAPFKLRGSYRTALDVLFILAMIGMHYFERFVLVKKPGSALNG